MRCAACGKDNSNARKFCAECGAALLPKCPACGFANERQDRFCGGCGKPLTGASPPSAPAVVDMRPATVLFVDLAGYTRLSNTSDPDDVRELLNDFFARTDRLIVEAGGTVDKHIGDCVMGIFGAPVAHDDDAERACRVALEILNEQSGRYAVHGGIASGQVLAGTTGSAHHAGYTVTGAPVNLAARLCDRARTGEFLVNEETARAAAARFGFSPAGSEALDGFDQTQVLFKLDGIKRGDAVQARAAFVGRAREIRQIEALLAIVRETERGQLIELVGEAGIGKSRLVEETASLGAENGFSIVQASISSLASGHGADVILQLVRAMVKLDVSTEKDDVRKLTESAGIPAEQAVFLYELLGLGIPEGLRGYYDALGPGARKASRARLLRALAQYRSEAGPLLVIIEDAHWAEPDGIAELGLFAGLITELPVALLITTRPEGNPLGTIWRANALATPVTTINLRALDPEACRTLGRSLLPGHELVEALVARAGGNPLFLTQLIRHTRDMRPGDLPDSIRSIVVARMDRLQEADRRAAQAASILGTRFSEAELEHLLERDRFDSEGLVGAHLIRTVEDGFEFIHALVRDAVYGTLPKSRRTALHLAAAAWYTDRDIGLEAHHLEQAQDSRAPGKYREAASAALAQYRSTQALAYNTRGLDLAKAGEDRENLLRQRGEILYETGDIDGSIAAWSEARPAASSDVEACEIELGLAQSLRVKDAHREADAALARAEEIALRQGLDLALSRINFVRGNLRFPQGRLDECLAAHEAALHYGRRAHSIEAEVRALGGIGDAQYAIGRMLSAHKAFSECVGLAHEHGFGRIEVANLPMLSFTTLAAGDMTGALQVEDRALGLARRVEALRAEMIAIQTACFRLLETEETKRAREYLMRSREIATRLGTTRFQAENFALLARLDFLEGERGSAIRLAREAWGMIDDTGKRFLGPMLLGVLRVTSDDEVERQWAVDEARLLLRESTLAHNHLLFNRLVLEDALDHEAWQEAYRCCDDLDRFVAPEPFPWATFLIRWGRALADLGSGEAGANLQAELDWVLAEANRFGFTRCARSICQSLTAGAQSR